MCILAAEIGRPARYRRTHIGLQHLVIHGGIIVTAVPVVLDGGSWKQGLAARVAAKSWAYFGTRAWIKAAD
jgi:hypothetical protein